MKIEMQNICKSFGGTSVLDNVNLSIKSGEIRALLGENGAGKSTLMNILGGVRQADAGTISVDGKKVEFVSPADSLKAGIAFIHQELNLINDLPIYENMFIGREIKKANALLDHKTMIAQTKEAFDKIDITLDPCELVRNLDASYKQIIEISRAMMMNASIIIMDEPTSSLTEPEIKRVFALMRQLQKHDTGMIFISHKLDEVLEICTTYTVLRDGHVVADGAVKDVTTAELALHMVGRQLKNEVVQNAVQHGKEMLRVEHYSDSVHFNDISFCVHQSETLGITGLLGDGRSELFLSLFHAGLSATGEAFLDGKSLRIKSTSDAVRKGLAYVPRNRKENAIIKDMNILENSSLAALPKYIKRGFISKKAERADFDKDVGDLRIKFGKADDLITSLSGGNQQKVVLAKWLNTNPKVFILDNPTQGVDVGAKEEIYEIIKKLAEQGVAVIVLSSEAQEIIRTCDRAIVMFHGSIMGEVSGADMNEHTIMRMATGERLAGGAA